MKLFRLAALLVTLPTAAVAEWPPLTWEFITGLVKHSCIGCSAAEQAEFDAEQTRIERVKAWGPTEMRSIGEWMASMGYDAPIMPSPPVVIANKVENAIHKNYFSGWKDTLGEYTPEYGIELRFEELYAKAIDAPIPYDETNLITNSDTLAHELFHGVQKSRNAYDFDNLWHSEGLPTAVAAAWTLNRYNLYLRRRANYSEPLHKPVDPYTRGEFFRALGTDLNPDQPVGYIADLLKTSTRDGANGLIWLDNFLKPKKGGLADYYPYFIAEHAQDARSFLYDGWVGPSPKPAPTPSLSPGASSQSETLDQNAREVASTYSDTTPVFTGIWTALEDSDRVYANIISIEDPERVADLHLVVRDQVYAGDERFVGPMFAEPGQMTKPYNARVTNVASNVPTSQPQKFTLRLETAKVGFELPDCLAPGEAAPIIINAPLSADEVTRAFILGPSKLRASAGRISDALVFTAPGTTGPATISLTLPTPAGANRTVQLGKIEVTKNCMIRMTLENAVATYSALDDFTEYKVPQEGVAMYLRPDNVAVQQGGGWVPLPGNAKTMLLASLNANATEAMGGTILDPVAGSGIEPFTMARMPKIYSKRFSWANLRHGMFADGPPNRTSGPCLGGGSGCSVTTFVAEGIPVSVTFDKSLRPISLTMQDHTVTFEYGSFPITHPPGW